MTTPPISSTFVSMDDFLNEPTADDSKSETITAGLPSPARSNDASTPASSFSPPVQPDMINWVGLLMEYAAQKGATPPAFSDIPQVGGLEPKFVTTVKIDERSEPFWDPNQTFPRKKLAKQFSCQLAMEWLKDNGYISPSKVPTQPTHRDSMSGILEQTSAATRVPELCKELRLTPPAYRMSNTPEAPMMWSGYATFPLNTEVPDRIGVFKNVMGKKQAKEGCAKIVIEFLEEYRRRKEGNAVV